MGKSRKVLGLFQAPVPAVMAEIHAANLKRIYYAAVILVPLHLLYALVFSSFSPSSAVAGEWRIGIMLTHSLMAGTVLILGGCARRARRRRISPAMGYGLVQLAYLLYLGLGIYLTVLDQRINSGMTPYIILCIVVAIVLRIHPISALVNFLLTYAVFDFWLRHTQPHPEIILSMRINASFITLLGIGISWRLWQHQLNLIYQQQKVLFRHNRMKLKNRQLQYLAGHDSLTGLLNRMRFREEAEKEIERMRRSGDAAAIIILDIDRFKAINDHYGHPVGDGVLREIADIIRRVNRQPFICARLGGEEFILLLRGVSASEAVSDAQLLCAAIEEHAFNTCAKTVRVTASFGVAPLHADGSDPLDQAYIEVDEALYRAKEKGGNTVEVAS